jgi:hypothetical protein
LQVKNIFSANNSGKGDSRKANSFEFRST